MYNGQTQQLLTSCMPCLMIRHPKICTLPCMKNQMATQVREAIKHAWRNQMNVHASPHDTSRTDHSTSQPTGRMKLWKCYRVSGTALCRFGKLVCIHLTSSCASCARKPRAIVSLCKHTKQPCASCVNRKCVECVFQLPVQVLNKEAPLQQLFDKDS